LTKATKLDEFFGLVFKSIKTDSNIPRIMAFIRRLIQMCYINEAGFSAATLLIISELIRVKEDLRFNLYSFHGGSTRGNMRIDDSDDEERFYDIDKLNENPEHRAK
jgi:ribosome biogenesis protein MAK21